MSEVAPSSLEAPLLVSERSDQAFQRDSSKQGGRSGICALSRAPIPRCVALLSLLGLVCFVALDGRVGRSPITSTAVAPLNLAGVSGLAWDLFSWLFFLAVVAGCVIGGALALQGAVVKGVTAAIEHFDRDYLGVDVDIGAMSFNAFTGRLQIQNLEVHNPEGYSPKGLLRAANFVIDLDVVRTIRTLGREFEIVQLTAKRIEANLEFNGYLWGKSNAMTIIETLKNSTVGAKGAIEPVYDYWHARNNEHTFHCEPAWPGEVKSDVQFFAYTEQAPNTEPVHDFWHCYYQEHVFRMGEAQSMLEKKGEDVHFYAFKDQAPDTEPVYEFWHTVNKEHTLHFEPAWPLEEKGELRFYAYRTDPLGKSRAAVNKPVLKPVYDFWHSGMGQHSFHFLPAWGGERESNIMFYAYDKNVEGTEAVWDFWHEPSSKKRFHIGEPREGEVKRSPLFYVHTSEVADTEPVHEFYHEKNNEYNLHFGEPWGGEEKRDIVFYAHREDPADKRKSKMFLRKVNLDDIKAQSSTKLAGMRVSIDDMKYQDFSEQFQTSDPKKLVEVLLNELFGSVSVGLG